LLAGPFAQLLLLLALGMGLIGLLVGALRVLFRSAGMLPALAVVPLAVMVGSCTVRLGGILMIFGSFVVFVSGHFFASWFGFRSQPASNRPYAISSGANEKT